MAHVQKLDAAHLAIPVEVDVDAYVTTRQDESELHIVSAEICDPNGKYINALDIIDERDIKNAIARGL